MLDYGDMHFARTVGRDGARYRVSHNLDNGKLRNGNSFYHCARSRYGAFHPYRFPRHRRNLTMRVIGYTYNADCHCVNCARDSLNQGQFGHMIDCPDGPGDDENGIPYDSIDREGNSIHPIFSTDEGYVDDEGVEHAYSCGDCGAVIE